MSKPKVRFVLYFATIFLVGCNYGFKFHPEEMTPDQMLERAELVVIGVIESHNLDQWPFFQLPPNSAGEMETSYWRPVRRRVRVENVLKGSYSEKHIDIYEIHWTGGATGNWNATQDNERCLFLVRRENGRWQIVRDWNRSIYEVSTGYHPRLPMDESKSFWERFALMSYWLRADRQGSFRALSGHTDPGNRLSVWRTVKLLRGLLHHPHRKIQIAACWNLALSNQMECVDQFTQAEWRAVGDAGMWMPAWPNPKWDAKREAEERRSFQRSLLALNLPPDNPRYYADTISLVRLATTVDNPTLRREFCAQFMAMFPGDTDNGCAAGKAIPATVVTVDGDVPLVGPWPTHP